MIITYDITWLIPHAIITLNIFFHNTLDNTQKNIILKVKNIILKLQKDLTELNDSELKDQDIKISKKTNELFTKPIITTAVDMEEFEKEEI